MIELMVEAVVSSYELIHYQSKLQLVRQSGPNHSVLLSAG